MRGHFCTFERQQQAPNDTGGDGLRGHDHHRHVRLLEDARAVRPTGRRPLGVARAPKTAAMTPGAAMAAIRDGSTGPSSTGRAAAEESSAARMMLMAISCQ